MNKQTIQLYLILLSISLILSKSADDFLSCVRDQLGKPYEYGAAGPDSFDCSGLCFYCYDGEIPRTTYDQINGGSDGDGSPGDIVLFGEDGSPTHAGACVGDGMMIHAPNTGEVVSYQQYIGNDYYEPRIMAYRRYWD